MINSIEIMKKARGCGAGGLPGIHSEWVEVDSDHI